MPDTYKRVGEYSKREIEERLTPLHIAILSKLPAEGSLLGYHPLYKTVRQLASELNADHPEAPKITTSYLSGQLRSMGMVELVVPVGALGRDKNGWQLTPYGAEVLGRRKA